MALNNYLHDEDFLRQLDLYPHKVKYAKIISLTNDEQPLEEIQGKVTSGSINIDGTAKVRRTCSLTLVSQDINVSDFYWGLNTKFKLEIGLENWIDDTYPDICWFPQGTYIITSFSESVATQQHSISISGKDKMCLLNGEVGGNVTAISVDFGTEDYTDANGVITNYDRLIKDIVRDAVHEYAFEPMENIIINDLDDYGIELMEYRGTTPLYLYISSSGDECAQVTMNQNTIVYAETDTGRVAVSLKEFEDKGYKFNTLVTLDMNNETDKVTPTIVYMTANSKDAYVMAKIDYGETPGYRLTGITYAGDLIISAGGTITSMLDKLVDQLGAFEYFYDTQGRFIFQKKKVYIQTSFNNLQKDGYETYADSAADYSPVVYSLEGNQLVSSFSNTPDLLNLKNDYSIWGTRESASGTEIPVHIRYAIDDKPTFYRGLNGIIYVTEEGFNEAKSLVNSKEAIRNMFRNTSLPACLSANGDNWWNIVDWAEMWKTFTGAYPTEPLYTYEQSRTDFTITDGFGFAEDVTESQKKDLKAFYFKVYVIDTNTNDLLDAECTDHNGEWQNGQRVETKCYHTYTELKDNNRNVYIWDPAFPEEITNYNNGAGYGFQVCDWREIIYQMMRDYRHYYYVNSDEAYLTDKSGSKVTTRLDFAVKVQEMNGKLSDGSWRYPKGVTGYEQYYTDVEGFWRQLYCPDWDFKQITLTKGDFIKYSKDMSCDIYMRFFDYEQCVYRNVNINKNIGYNTFEKVDNEASIDALRNKKGLVSGRIYWYYNSTTSPVFYIAVSTSKVQSISFEYNSLTSYYQKGTEGPWNEEIYNSPETLNFWFDFMDTDSDMGKYAVSAIGDRTKTVNDQDVKAIYFRTTPTVIFYNPNTEETLDRKSGYTYIQCPEYMENLFVMSAQGKSAKNVLDTNLYNYSYCTESVSISAVPIYYLEPNNRIAVKDEATKIDGEYIVSKISLPLTYNGVMQITATKAAVRLY